MSKHMNPQRQKQMLARLARAEGQLRGVQELIRKGEDCEVIAQQLSAARKALDKAFFAMVGCLLEEGALDPKELSALLVKFS
jgi:CsoR family transcriptional regulator, copper-sensing transcriptional repressor